MYKKLKALIIIGSLLCSCSVSYANTIEKDIINVPYTTVSKEWWNKGYSREIKVVDCIKEEMSSNVKVIFTPTDTGYYSIMTRGNSDTVIDYFNTKKGELIRDNDSGHNKNALLYVYCEKGRDYKFIIKSKGNYILDIQRGMPTSGFEQDNWKAYQKSEFEETNNCYTYMLGLYKNFDGEKFRVNGRNPGEFGGADIHTSWFNSIDLVDTLVQNRVGVVDGFPLYPIKEWEIPRKGYYKVALVMKKDYDIHWYRQNPDGSWSHKPGTSAVRFTDWSNNIIYNPQYSDMGAYDEFVSYYEVINCNRLGEY